MIYEYWKGRLNAAQQKAYEDVLLGVTRRQERIPVRGVHPQELSLIHKAVYYDHPELFYMTHAPSVQQSVGFMGVSVTFICKSIFSASVIASYQKKIEDVKALLEPLMSSAPNEYEKEIIVCNHILRTVTYHIDNTLNQNAGTALVQGRAQCSGIAKAVKLLFDSFGITSLIIDGEATDPSSGQRGPHAWNLVCIGGVWYHLDVTSMLGANMRKTEPFQYLYLNETDAQMRTYHVWREADYPLCTTPFSAPVGGTPSACTAPVTAPVRPVKTAPAATTPARPTKAAPVRPAPRPSPFADLFKKPLAGSRAGQKATPQTPTAPSQSSGVRPRGASGQSAPTPTRASTPRPQPPQPANVPSGQATSAPKRVRKTVSSLAQFRRDITNIYNARLRMFQFISTIPAGSRQELLDLLLQAAGDEARKQNLQLKINVSIDGEQLVKVELGW